MLGSIPRWLALFVLLSRAVSGQGNVLVVGPGSFSDIPAAVLAAQDGDTILVRLPSTSDRNRLVEIVGKGLTIVADSNDAFVDVLAVDVRDLPAGKTVLLSRISANERGIGSFVSGATIRLRNNAGNVRLVSCKSLGLSFGPLPALRIESSSGSTALAACDLAGGPGGGGHEVDGEPGAAGLELEDALAATFDSILTGGQGGPLVFADHPGPGGAGATVRRGVLPTRLLLANSVLHGGQGGLISSCAFFFVPSGAGGPGFVLGTGATAARLATSFTGGAGGAVQPCGTSGPAGLPLVNSGLLQTNPSSALRLTTPTVAREGETITLTIRGVPGDRVTLFSGTETTFHEGLDGVRIVQPGRTASAQRGPVGTIGSSGILTVPYTFPALPEGVGALNLWFQAFAWHANGKRTLGSFSVVTVLDSIY